MSPLVLSGARLTIEDVASVALRRRPVTLDPGVLDELAAGRRTLDRVAATGQPIYGYNTGLGANLAERVTEDPAAFQAQFLDGRSAAMGEPLPTAIVRATMLARAGMLAAAGSGISPHILEALVAALNAGVHPVMPRHGSIGAGDLVVMAAIAQALTGRGEAEFQGRSMPAAEALAAAGLRPAFLAPKDGASLVNASAVAAGQGALVVGEARALLDRQTEAAALSMEGLGANFTILDVRVQAARPAAGQAEAAARLRALTDRPERPPPRSIQDPLSVRCACSIHGAAIGAVEATRAAVETEINSAGDNPLVLGREGIVLATGNFHTPALALAFETLGLAIAQTAAAAAARVIQLTGGGRDGLPKYLSPVGGPAAGFVPMQKTVVSLLAAIRRCANPAMLDFLPVSEGVEDHATQTLATVAKTAEMLPLWRRIVACELLAAAQAVDLRGVHLLAPGTARCHARVRALVPALAADRPLGRDAEAIFEAMQDQEETS